MNIKQEKSDYTIGYKVNIFQYNMAINFSYNSYIKSAKNSEFLGIKFAFWKFYTKKFSPLYD